MESFGRVSSDFVETVFNAKVLLELGNHLLYEDEKRKINNYVLVVSLL